MDENNETYVNDNDFNDNGIEFIEEEMPNEDSSPIQSTSGFNHGIKNEMSSVNGKNNPALGQNRFKNPLAMPDKGFDPKKKSASDNGLNDKNSLAKGNKDGLDKKQGDAPSKNNPLPGANINKKANNPKGNDNNKKELSQNKDEQGFNPRKSLAGLAAGGIANSIKSRLGLGKQKENAAPESNNSDSGEGNALANGIKSIWAAIPLQAKIIVTSGAVLLIFAFILVITLFSAITASFFNSECDQPSYAVNSSNATEFLCNMQSPFKGDGYVVTGVSGWRNHPDGTGVKFHYGTDVVGNGGASQKIYAVADGTVVVAGVYQGYGNAVKINHNGQFTSLYGHMSSISSEAKAALKNNSEIKAGTFLGIQGNTGQSYGVHLHFELADSNGKYVSANPFFGYSDQGYDQCINPDKAMSGSSDCIKSDTPVARKIGQEGFNQICGRTNAFTTNASTSNSCCGTKTSSTTSGSLIDFIGVFEGGVGKSYQCKTSSGAAGYIVYNHGDKNTVGPGVTTDYLPGITVGECVAKSKVEAGMDKAISKKRNSIQSKFANAKLTKYQEDAMVSMAYNGCGDFFGNIAKAAKNDNLKEVWNAMKGCYHSNGVALDGLKKRRKAEFALYVTGDYSIAKSYTSKSWTDAEYNDYDSDGVIAKKASGTSSNSCSPLSGSGSSSGNKVIDIAIKELEKWNSYSKEDQYCTAVKKYIKSCSGTATISDYCAGFVTYALKEAGVFDSLGLSSTTCVVSDFKNSSKVTVHKAGGSYTPKPGDLFIKVDSGGHDWGHIGFVEKVNGKTIHTIEGNTDPFEGFCSKGVSDGHGGTVGNGNVRRKTHTEGSNDITHYISY